MIILASLAAPSRKRFVVQQVQVEFEVSGRRACAVTDQPRSSQR